MTCAKRSTAVFYDAAGMLVRDSARDSVSLYMRHLMTDKVSRGRVVAIDAVGAIAALTGTATIG